MKVILSTIALSLILFQMQAQNADGKKMNKRHEINIGIGDLFNRQMTTGPIYSVNANGQILPNTNDVAYYNTNITPPKLGLGYKFYLSEKHALRAQANFKLLSTSSTTSKLITTRYIVESEFKTDLTQIEARLGYQFIHPIGKAALFFGADVLYQFTNIDTKTTNRNTFIDSGIQFTGGTEVTSGQIGNAFGTSPFIGIRYFLASAISISMETRMDIIYEDITTTTSNSVDFNTIQDKSSNRSIKPLPIGFLSLNFHL